MVFAKTEMEDLPKNCNECKLTTSFSMECRLPFDKRTGGYSFKKSCMAKRHNQCPLVEIKEEDPA